MSVSFQNPPHLHQPVGQYSQLSFVPAGTTLVHVAGQLPMRPDGSLLAPDFDGQAEAVFAMLADAIDAAGSSMTSIVYLRTYLVRDSDYPAFKAVRARVFERHGMTEPPPATTITVAGLVAGSLIELDATAAVVAPPDR
jgi:enamine deaminase RidA (YjgF/YER057c/UK114 family)